MLDATNDWSVWQTDETMRMIEERLHTLGMEFSDSAGKMYEACTKCRVMWMQFEDHLHAGTLDELPYTEEEKTAVVEQINIYRQISALDEARLVRTTAEWHQAREKMAELADKTRSVLREKWAKEDEAYRAQLTEIRKESDHA